MLTNEQLKELALHAVRGTVPSTFSIGEVDTETALRDALRPLAGSLNRFEQHKHEIYEILIETADEIVPKKVIDAVGIFAEVQVVPQGKKVMFQKKIGRNRARQFVTRVGVSGVYETFRLDSKEFTIETGSLGGAISFDFERYLDGAESMTDLMNIITEDLSDAIYQEVHEALRAAVNATGRPTANYYVGAGFDADEMVRLINTVRAYGSAVIFAPPEFVSAMGADAIVPVGASYQGIYHPQDIDAIHNQGFINIFRGTPIVMMQQSFQDESNTSTWIDPQIAYILPVGSERVVKVVLEGETQITDINNADHSKELHFWKKGGVAILAHHNWAVYKNTDIEQTYVAPFGNI
jgi:hypothetical protein